MSELTGQSIVWFNLTSMSRESGVTSLSTCSNAELHVHVYVCMYVCIDKRNMIKLYRDMYATQYMASNQG